MRPNSLAGFVALAMLAGLMVGGVGCTPSPPSVISVSGKLTSKDGKPLPKVLVTFLPDPERGNTASIRSTGTTDANGQFSLTTDDQRPGAIVGAHRVTLLDLTISEAVRGGKPMSGRQREDEAERLQKIGKMPQPRFGIAYGDALKSPLKIEVQEGNPEIHLQVD